MLWAIKISKKNIPNVLTFGRIFLSVIVILCFFLSLVIDDHIYSFTISSLNLVFEINLMNFIATILFTITASTDFLDGYLARKWNVISDLGKMIDPIADKILINGSLLALAVNNSIALSWAVAIFLFRDILVDAFRMYAAQKQKIIPANSWGKWKTTFQMLSIIILGFVFGNKISDYNDHLWFYYIIQNGFVLVSAILSLWSLVTYVKLLLKINFR